MSHDLIIRFSIFQLPSSIDFSIHWLTLIQSANEQIIEIRNESEDLIKESHELNLLQKEIAQSAEIDK